MLFFCQGENRGLFKIVIDSEIFVAVEKKNYDKKLVSA